MILLLGFFIFLGCVMTVTVFIFLAALLPLVATVSAKAGGKEFSNNEPRDWLEQQKGWRGRANAAQANIFESLPFFYAALLYAHFNGTELVFIQGYASLWLVLRLAYILAYIKDKAGLRSFLWLLAFVVTGLLLFS